MHRSMQKCVTSATAAPMTASRYSTKQRGSQMPKVLYEKRGEIAYITRNRPDKRNAIDTETDDLLFEAWSGFRADPDVRLAILTGAGDQAFCAGADLSSHVDGWLEGGPGLGRGLLERGFAGGITRGLHRTFKPIIATLNGWVIGGGIELALACDIRVAADDIQFGFYHMRRDRKSTRLNSSHSQISYAVFCLKKKKISHSIVRCRTSTRYSRRGYFRAVR